jgi:hypothetical protein
MLLFVLFLALFVLGAVVSHPVKATVNTVTNVKKISLLIFNPSVRNKILSKVKNFPNYRSISDKHFAKAQDGKTPLKLINYSSNFDCLSAILSYRQATFSLSGAI